MTANVQQLPGLRALFAKQMDEERSEIEAKRRYESACDDLVNQTKDLILSAIKGQTQAVALLGNVFKIGGREICKLRPCNGGHNTAPCVEVVICGKPAAPIGHYSPHSAAQAVLMVLAKEAARY